MTHMTFASLDLDAICATMQEAVGLAIEIIRGQRFTFTVIKTGSGAQTSADILAQQAYLSLLRERFPTFGIIAEEGELRSPCTDPSGNSVYFTVDSLDGTNAFIRRQSHGIGTMVSCVCNDTVIAAYVGDVLTRDVYGFRYDQPGVTHDWENKRVRLLSYDESTNIEHAHISLRRNPSAHQRIFRDLAASSASPDGTVGLCAHLDIETGSIGISTARLWKGEVAAMVLWPVRETPWDMTPIFGITKHLGFIQVEFHQKGHDLIVMATVPLKTTLEEPKPRLTIHASALPRLRTWHEDWKLRSR